MIVMSNPLGRLSAFDDIFLKISFCRESRESGAMAE